MTQKRTEYHPPLHAEVNASARLDKLTTVVECLPDGAQMFPAVRLLYRKPYIPPVIHNEHGHTVNDVTETD